MWGAFWKPKGQHLGQRGLHRAACCIWALVTKHQIEIEGHRAWRICSKYMTCTCMKCSCAVQYCMQWKHPRESFPNEQMKVSKCLLNVSEFEKAPCERISPVRTHCHSPACPSCPSLYSHSWQNKEREEVNTTEKEKPSLSQDGSAVVAVWVNDLWDILTRHLNSKYRLIYYISPFK